MSRGNGKMAIYIDDRDYRQFVHLLGQVCEDARIRCWNYCLMPNHYHVTVEPTGCNLSSAVQRLNGAYGLWWNRRHERVGHVFQGRFKDQVVDRETYLLALSRYVVMNPVRARIVAEPQDWCWSSFRATMGHSPCPSFLDVSATLRLFGNEDDELQCREQFMRHVLDTDADQAIIDRIRSADRILGPKSFKERVLPPPRAR